MISQHTFEKVIAQVNTEFARLGRVTERLEKRIAELEKKPSPKAKAKAKA